MDVSFRKPKTIDDFPAEFLFHYSCGRLIKELPGMHVGSLIQLKEGLDELTRALNTQIMKQPEEIRNAFGINVVDLEENPMKLILEKN